MAHGLTSSCYSTLGRGVVGNAVRKWASKPSSTTDRTLAEMGQNFGLSSVYGGIEVLFTTARNDSISPSFPSVQCVNLEQ